MHTIPTQKYYKFNDVCNLIKKDFDLGLNKDLIIDFLEYQYGHNLHNSVIVFLDDDTDTQEAIYDFTSLTEEVEYLNELIHFIFTKVVPGEHELALYYYEDTPNEL